MKMRLLPAPADKAPGCKFTFDSSDVQGELLRLTALCGNSLAVSVTRQSFIYEYVRRGLPVPNAIIVDDRDAWVATYIADGIADPSDPYWLSMRRSRHTTSRMEACHATFISCVVAQLISDGKGTVFCSSCGQSYHARVMHTSCCVGPPMMRLIDCPMEHRVLVATEHDTHPRGRWKGSRTWLIDKLVVIGETLNDPGGDN